MRAVVGNLVDCETALKRFGGKMIPDAARDSLRDCVTTKSLGQADDTWNGPSRRRLLSGWEIRAKPKLGDWL